MKSRFTKSFFIFFLILSFLFLNHRPAFAINISSPDNIEYITGEYFDNINDIFVDQHNGHIYVPSYTGIINYFDGNTWTTYDVSDHATSINNIAVDSTGKMYITSDCEIHIFNADGSFVSSESTEGCFTGVAVDNEDNIFAIIGSYIIYHEYNEEYDSWNWWDYDDSMMFMTDPSDIYIDQNNTVYVTDAQNRKVYRHTEGGEWETLPDLSEVDEPSGVYSDSTGNIFVLDRDYGHVAMLDNETNEWGFYNDSDVLGQAEGVATFDDNNYLYVYVTNNTFGDKKIVKLTYNLPQPTTTSTPQLNNPSSSNSAPGWSAPNCSDPAPVLTPDLFQINTTAKTAKLFFTPIDYNQFFISFSTKPIAEDYSADVTLAREGVQNFTINLLQPNTIYYIKVRGQNGCMPGFWSNTMKFKTNSQIYYKNFSPTNNLSSNLTTKTSSKNIPSPTVIPESTPIVTQTPKPNDSRKPSVPTSKQIEKKCFLWWCW